MNSEELELSLRAEFESYLNRVFGRLREDVSEFQKNFEAEFERHKAQMHSAISDLNSRIESSSQFDKAFTESVTEHLRLARDEGAKLTAEAMGEAAKLDGGTVAAAGYDRLRDAINEISGKTSQSAILRALVEQASEFTPRGAFFIVKNDRFVCWKVFGRGIDPNGPVPDVQLPVAEETILADAVRSLATKEGAFGTYSGDAGYLNTLGFGQPDRMYAVPLTARGRGVAVLYADYGTEGVSLNIEAIETLVRVAGLTVELHAASQAARQQPDTAPHHAGTEAAKAAPTTEEFQKAEPASAPSKADEQPESTKEQYQNEAAEAYAFSTQEKEPAGGQYDSEAEADAAYGEQSPEDEGSSHEETAENEPASFETTPEVRFESAGEQVQFERSGSEFSFTTTESEPPASEPAAEQAPQPEYEHAGVNGNGHSYHTSPSVTTEIPAPAESARSRFGSRNLDLPIEVEEGERKLHNDARRFARLLVSEIKLYNEQQVNEAREKGDIYVRLREAIDRSREMYDNRVKPEVAAKFDYFHYELVNGLADGNPAKLGAGYPGAAV